MEDKSCIFILADGARADLFEYLLLAGDLPNISKYIVDEGSFTQATTVFPSTTGPAYTPYLIGKFPGRCNLPGIRWFDKNNFDSNKFSLKSFRSYIGPETYLINSDIDTNGVPTLFESIPRSVSILNEITRGIQNGGDKTKLLKTYYKIKSHFTDGCSEVDRVAGDMLLRSLEKNPDFAFCVFLGIDTYSHQFHPFHKKVVDSYKLIDEYVGLIGSYLEKEKRLEDTLIILGSDHGLTPTHSHFDLLNFIDDQDRKTFYYPNIFRHLFDADASCMVSGNSMAHLYFKTGNRWDNETSIDGLDKIVNSLLERPEIDLVLGKNSEGSIIIKSRRGEAKTNSVNDKITYKVVSNDPFGFSNIPNTASADLMLEKTFNTNYPDVLVQINQLFDSARTGDLVVSAANGFDLRAYHEKPEHCASHGSLLKEHMLVPLVLNKKIKKKFVRTTDTYPTIMKFLNIQVDESIDGISLI